MNQRSFDPVPAARHLATYWSGFDQLDALKAAEKPRSIDEGYMVQRRLIEEIDEPIMGYKLGMSSMAAMEKSGMDTPIMGFVPQSRLLLSGESIALPPSGEFLIELEIAFVLTSHVYASAGAVSPHLAFEIVRSRFSDSKKVGMPSHIADAAGLHALVVGDPVPLGELDELPDLDGRIEYRGKAVATGLSGPDCPAPLDIIGRFGLLAEKHRFPTKAGMIIATGDIVTALDTDSRGVFEGRLGDSGVRVRLT